MIIFKIADALSGFVNKALAEQSSIGFVPTMGALHKGHISLIKQSKKENSLCICSIFINPTQFNNPEDFRKYPVTIEADIDMLEAAGCDVLFLPDVNEIYPPGSVKQQYELGYLETILEGRYRPGHFQGVCQVVDRLLGITTPTKLYLGQKDFQQCMVISRLLELKHLSTQLVFCPTLREPDGLAMSSRNQRLSADEREIATGIFKALSLIKNGLRKGSLAELKHSAVAMLTAFGFKVDYVEIADSSNLDILDNWDGTTKAVALIAAYLNEVRLIDNLPLN